MSKRHGFVGQLTAPEFPCIENSFLLDSSVRSAETHQRLLGSAVPFWTSYNLRTCRGILLMAGVGGLRRLSLHQMAIDGEESSQ